MEKGYHDNDELRELIEAQAEAAGERALLESIGETLRGQPIRAVIVAAPGRRPGEERPRVLISANIHGQEIIGSELALHLLGLLCEAEPQGAAAELLELADVIVVPAVNLDSREVTLRGLRAGYPFAKAPRGNAHGVDLNRNFPFPSGAKEVWYPLAGTKIRWLPWYRGPAALSEPEAKAMAELGERVRPAAAVNLHSVGRLFLYPYCYSHKEPADLGAFRAMGEAFKAAQPRPYKVKQSRSWYAILGDMDDYFYDTFGTLSVTVELSRPAAGVGWNPLRLLFPVNLMNPRRPAPTIANTAEACFAALAEGVRQKAH